jgi:hypothetical protein
MPEIFDRDLVSEFSDRLAGRMQACTFTKVTNGAIDIVNDPTGSPAQTSAQYTADGISFRYKESLINGETILVGDYQVLIMLGSIMAIGDDATHADLDLSMFTTHVDTVIEAVAEGAGGNSITVELVGDASSPAGSISEVGTNVRISFDPTSSLVLDIETLIATATLVRVKTIGTPGNVLDATDELAAVALAGGSDATATQSDVVPSHAEDTITIPPPGSDTPATARVVDVVALTHVAITLHVRGNGK